MNYIVYKNIEEDDFIAYKAKLNILEIKIVETFSNLISQKREDAADFLAANFRIKDSLPFQGSIGISFEDLPGVYTFKIGVVKFFDENGYRYIKKELIEHVNFAHVEKKFVLIIENFLSKYYSWTKKDVTKARKIKLPY